MPWLAVEKEYVFDTPKGKKSLAELFDGRDQLVVYHFMLGPDWTAGCPGCSFLADHRFETGFVAFACVLASAIWQLVAARSR